QPERNELVCVSLHGDYRYDKIKNTTKELQSQEGELKAALISTIETHSLVVNGYSGRDPSIMDGLREAVLQENARGKVYWCGFSDEPTEEVAELLLAAAEKKVEAYYVPGVGFDDLMIRLAHHCLEGSLLENAKRILGDQPDRDKLQRNAFSISQADPTDIIKSNAWPVRCPSEMFEFQLRKWPEDKVWKWLANKTVGHQVVAVPFKKVLALGTLDGIRNAFNDLIDGEIQRVPITEQDVRYEDGAVVSLLRQALVRSIAEKRELCTDGSRTLWKKGKYTTERGGSDLFDVHHAARISMRRIGEQMYFVLDPTVYFPAECEDNEEAIRNIRLRILGYQHNDKFNADLNDWRKLILTQNKPTEFDFPYKSASFTFVIKSAPIFAAIRHPRRNTVNLPESFERLLHHRGIEIPEQALRFASKAQSSATDTLPLRGLAINGPFDRSVAPQVDDGPIKVAVICPRAEAPLLEQFLADSSRTHNPQRGTKEEYLVRYTGFENVYRVPVIFPGRGDPLWYTLPEVDSQLDERDGALDISRKIRDGISTLAAADRAIILIFTPDRWRRWRGFNNDNEVFDVHDFVKAYCVQRGIATQFLNQDTLGYQDKCRVWWWLSVAIYAKAMRTPWVLDGLDPDTAFVGLGYAINQRASKGKHIVLGCSHLYNAQGQGLQFRLSRIENPIISGGNPFLSFQDARRLGETIRTLFWESHLKLPIRVVIHKQTPFRSDEQQGLRAGLEGVKDLELIEINFESALRYISSQPTGNKFIEGRFPVRRGTVVKLTDYEALLWVHGSTEAAKTNWTYFQGKRRIPGPVVLRRYAGTSDLATLANEILGLSKMDWNSGDLYAKLPATVQSSKRIARIGSLLDRFSNSSYDYRLFM
ncbi:MAG: SIR2 family protein, partial [Planctomycetota bacterium]